MPISVPISILNDNAILGVNNHNRVDRNIFDSSDNSTSNSWSQPRGHRSTGKGHKGGHKHHGKDC